ncbi:hypothetical protein [Flagellimonas sp. SN16]|uniref:hypothetical protein n=1 Tax=Flagellimonas sp. SN16 TaxID=3415142 RepID=UPI003C416CAC
MAVKYRIDYTSVNDVEYRCDISNPDYSGDIIELEGNVIYGLNNVDSLSHPIRSKYLNINVTATLAQPLEDLLTQGERYWRVELYRDSNKIFFGYLTSESSPQSFVEDKWTLSVDALDPLAFLEDLAYVDNAGSEYNGDERLGRVIANCLKRGFEDSSERFNILGYIPYDFRTRIDSVTYNEYTSGTFMTAVTLSQDDFIDEDSDEVLSCQEVLQKVLESLQLTITQINGDTWLISHYLYDVSGIASKYIEHYDSDWITTAGAVTSPWTVAEIKTDSTTNDPDDIMHCNENQQYYYNYALGKKVIDHKYSYKSTLLDNAELDGGTVGVSIPSWDIDTSYAYPNNDGTFRIYRNVTSTAFNEVAESLTNMFVFEYQTLKLQISAEANYDPGGVSVPIILYQVFIENVNTASVWALSYTGSGGAIEFAWLPSITDPVNFNFPTQGDDPVLDSEILFEQELPPIPGSGTWAVTVKLYEASPSVSPANTTDYITIHSIDLVPNTQEITGTSAIAERTDGYKSDKAETYLNTGEDTVTHNVLRHEFSGSPSITHVRDVLYDASSWFRLNYIKSHNDIINNKLKIFFTGDFWNFFEPHQLVNIPDLNENDFRVLEYSFDTAANQGTVKLEENNTDTVSATVSTSNIYAETVKPTIK